MFWSAAEKPKNPEMYQDLSTPGAFMGSFSILRRLIKDGVLPE